MQDCTGLLQNGPVLICEINTFRQNSLEWNYYYMKISELD